MYGRAGRHPKTSSIPCQNIRHVGGTQADTHASTHVCTHVPSHGKKACPYTCLSARRNKYTWLDRHACLSTCLSAYLYSFLHACAHVCLCTCVHMSTYCPHTFPHTCLPTCLYACRHTQELVRRTKAIAEAVPVLRHVQQAHL